MEDPKVPFADTTARRAQLMAATERFKNSISDGVDDMKEDAVEIGKTAVFVAGAALAVYLVANAILPKSDEYRYAEKYGEPEDWDEVWDEETSAYREPAPLRYQTEKLQKETAKTSAAAGLISGIVTSVLTNIAREQLTGFLARIRTNNAINPTADPTEYHQQAPTEPVGYTS
ncbi:hypothetical protein GCM10028807_57480 [Spirosoma daeguense]